MSVHAPVRTRGKRKPGFSLATRETPTTDAVEIMDRRYFRGRPHRLAQLEQARLEVDIAQKVYDLRTAAGLSQQQLAERVKTTASAICRLEDADYEGHSLSMLRRIASALGHRVVVSFVPVQERKGKKAG